MQSQLADLSRQLESARGSTLTADEQKRFAFIIQKLNASDDVTFDEGVINYNLAIAAFCQPGTLSDGLNGSIFAQICPG